MVNIWLKDQHIYGRPYCRLVKSIDEGVKEDPARPSNNMQRYWPQRYHWQFVEFGRPAYFGENENYEDRI